MISKEQTFNRLASGLEKLNIELPAHDVLELLWQYFSELVKWSTKINLVAKGPELELLETHFLDCLTLVPIIKKTLHDDNSHNLLDIGSGAGFPGLVLKIAFPDLPVTLVEPRQKRTIFLRHIARTLKLEKLTILEERIDKNDQRFAKNHGQFSLITCRALTKIEDFLEMVCNIAAPQTKILFMKGPKAADEIKTWLSTPTSFKLDSVSSLTLPFSGANRSLVIISKINQLTN